jgi:hypothetical protein
MFILDVQPEQHREVPVLMSQAERCAGDGCRNARPDPVTLFKQMHKEKKCYLLWMCR